ncbi:MAG: NAD-dependent epimerase/dehydratase family protein [Phycisphaeraceae bacterium]|nr:NAD-dependent epimerase/dehydratase family protein [Phycisphaeraceae bacterium]
MLTTRREFLQSSAALSAGLALGVAPALAMRQPARIAKPMRILILGGTGFLGPAIVEAALERGHSLTLFNRGRTEQRTGHTFEGRERIEKRHGNRDPRRLADEAAEPGPDNPMGLTQLREGEWDAVIDTSAYFPRVVNASAELLSGRVGQYVFISTVSVYASHAKVNADETSPLGTIPDPTVEQVTGESYGPLKALCEQAAEASMPGKATIVRPGLIVGPGDPTDRFTYWPVRVARGGEVLAPGTPNDPVQIIDVRDLAEWIVRLIEKRTMGIFDALGPDRGIGIGEVLQACKQASDSDAIFRWADAAFLREQGVSGWSDMPAWLPPEGDYAGFGQRSCARAIAAGLTFRTILTTAEDTLAWWNTQPEDRTARLRAGISPEREAAVLEALAKRNGG